MAAAVPVAPDRNVESSYHAPPGCPTQGDYVQYVESRSLKLRLFAEPAAVETSERVSVRIQPATDAAGWRGALVIEGPAPLEREVRGERCEDVVLALALITVLRLDPNRESEAPATAAPGAAALAAAGPSGAATTATSSTPAALSTTPSAARAAPSVPSAPEAAASAAAAAASASPAAPAAPAEDALAPVETRPVPASDPNAAPGATAAAAPESDAAGSGASGSNAAALAAAASASAPSDAALEGTAVAREAGATSSVSDSGPVGLSNAAPFMVEPALAAYVGYASSPSHAFEAMLRGEARFRPGIAAWAGAVSLSYGHSSQQNPSVDLDFDSLLAGLSLCPPGLQLSAGIWLQACGEARGGVLAISVTERELPTEGDPQVQPRPWFELGPSLQAGLPLSSRWSLRALTSVTLVLMRDSFGVERVVVDEDGQERKEFIPLYRPPLASFALLLGLGYEF